MQEHHAYTDEIQHYTEAALSRVKKHPLVVDAKRGRLSRDQALRWINCAGRESRTFPVILENMLCHADDPAVRAVLEQNLNDEYGGGDPEQAHFRHYLTLLDELGVGREQFEQYEERAGIRLALDLAACVSAQPDLRIALGYMLVNESMTAVTYSAVEIALRRFYPDLNTPFFALHVAVDAVHLEDLLRAIDRLGATSSDAVRFGVDLGERGMAVLLDEAYGTFSLVAA